MSCIFEIDSCINIGSVYSFKVHDCTFVDNTNVRGTVRYLINSILKVNIRMGIM